MTVPLSAYWLCQIVGWSATIVVTGGIPILYGGFRWPVAARAILGALLGLLLTHRLRRHMKRMAWLSLALRRLVPRVIAASLVISAAMVLGILPFLLLIIPPPNRAGPIAAIYAYHLAIVLGWILIYTAVHYLTGIRTAEAEKWRLELAARDAELGALRAQLNPHFLFNSLNSLRALVTENPVRAQEAITSLAALLRYTLHVSRARTTTLERELEVTQRYLDLEALRFEARLRYEVVVEPAALDHPVPPMLVQTIVENAMKHGISQLPEGGSIRIQARRSGPGLHIAVTNSGTLSADGPRALGEGIGLANSMERLRLMFGGRVSFDLRQSAPREVTCDVLVPAPVGPLTHAGAPAARGAVTGDAL